MVTPPDREGKVNPALLVAAAKIGIREIYKVGSAWAIAALAYGTATIPRVDVIVGPGNQYVAEAKQQVSGRVRIDMVAGPSEVLIVADEIRQSGLRRRRPAGPGRARPPGSGHAGHHQQPKVAEGVVAELERQLPLLSREEIARQSLARAGRHLPGRK